MPPDPTPFLLEGEEGSSLARSHPDKRWRNPLVTLPPPPLMLPPPPPLPLKIGSA